MAGTHPQTMGGISTVVRGYLEGGLFERMDCTYLITHVDGSNVRKGRVALGAYLRFIWLLLVRPLPLIHIHLSSRASFWRKSVLCLMAVAAGRPYLLHLHGSEFMRFHDEESGPGTRRFIRWIFARSACVIALSEQWRQHVLAICADANVEVLPNAVAVPADAPDNTSRGARTILFLGRLGRRKGTFDLVRAFAAVKERFPDASLVCAGDGEVDAVRLDANKLGIGASVACPGWVSPDAARSFLRDSAVFVLPSYAEGVPMALLEAMAEGLPVVTTPVGGIPQVVQHGDNGLLVEPGDVGGIAAALERLLASEELRRSLGRRAKATIQADYSLARTLAMLQSLYLQFGILPRRSAE